MSNIKKLMMSAAGGDVVNVEDVFSPYLYYGTNTSNTITNSLDLAGEGGLVWTKRKDSYSYQSDFHHWFDTVRGASKILYCNETAVEATDASILSSFNSDGFTLGTSSRANQGSEAYASWSFRQHPKFFQIKTFSTSYNTDPSYLTHDLECDLGMAIFKSRDNASQANNWIVWHKDSPSNSYFRLNTSAGFVQDNSNPIGYDSGTKTFTFNYPMTVAGDRMIAGNQVTTNFVGYFFANNNNDGEFGKSGDQDIIKCGKYTGNGSSDGPEIDLGFEPQWILIKRVNSTGAWSLHDNLLGITLPGVSQDRYIDPSTNAPVSSNVEWVGPTSTGFKLKSGNQNASGNDYIYVAIRKGMKAPSSASEVFNVTSRPAPVANQPQYPSDFGPVDLYLERDVATTHDWNTMTRLNTKRKLITNSTAGEASEPFYSLTNVPEIMSGISSSFGGEDADELAWMWKRAEGFCDVVGYTGNGTARTISHNLGVEPELIITKVRDSTTGWNTYVGALGAGKYIKLDVGNAAFSNAGYWNNTSPTESVFSVGANSQTNNSGKNYIAYLFASLAGVSKVGSYTGNGSSQTIDCGFTSGARFILVKRTDSNGSWYVWDTERGIVAGNDPRLNLDTTAAEVTSDDSVDPANSGFIVNQVSATTNINVSSAEYIFYAIA